MEVIIIFEKNEDFTITKTTFCYYKKVKKDYVLEMNCRNNHGLTILLSGKMKLIYPDCEYNIEEGDIILQRNGDSYILKADGCDAEYIVTSYMCEPENFIETCFGNQKVFSPLHIRRYADAFGKMADAFFNSGAFSKPLLKALTQEILCNILMDSQSALSCGKGDIAEISKNFIDEYYSHFIMGEDIANAANCSASHLRRVFSQTFGETPNKYLNRVRIEKAKEMLSSRLFTVEETALSCGFRNVYYFNKVFKQYTGTTPGKY